MIIVSDTSPIINLAIIGELRLIKAIFNKVIIPHAVYHEIVIAGAGLPGAIDILNADWVEVKQCTDLTLLNQLRNSLHYGEAEGITLALETQAELLLIDENSGRTVALAYGLTVTGTLGIILRAKSQGLIPSVKPLMDALIQNARFFVSNHLYQRILTLAGE